jgi:hypothetical protein
VLIINDITEMINEKRTQVIEKFWILFSLIVSIYHPQMGQFLDSCPTYW